MELKHYQRNTLNVLKSFFEQCRITGHIEAYKKITNEPEIAQRLGTLKSQYKAWDALPNTPRVCLKVPTGGGKTIIAAHAVKIAGDTWCEKDYPLVLWFVPSDTIRRQTAEALKNPRHPYRQVLDEQFAGKVRVFDLDEKFTIRPADINENACIIVSTIQSFVKEDTTKYNVYRDNENLEPHFAQMNKSRFAGMESANNSEEGTAKKREETLKNKNEKLSRNFALLAVSEEGTAKNAEGREKSESKISRNFAPFAVNNDRPKYSFANLLYYHRPIMIVDEAHKAVTDLTQETGRRINPAAIIEFTATPVTKDGIAYNNVLYNVRATELKEEEMIKLPIALVEHSGWELAVDEAIARRAQLEEAAKNERDYLRPILLFQAQSKDKDVTVDVLKMYLLETANLPEAQIKIATGDQKELDGIDIFNKNEPTRFIITVEALREGWDCSFAYVLCSLANIKSDTSVEQLLGRVMRMPYAKSRKIAVLNKAYAYVVSPHFGEAAAAITEKLINKGFDEEEARYSIQSEPATLFGRPEINKVDIETPIQSKDIPQSIQIEKNDDGKCTLVFTNDTTEQDIDALCTHIKPHEVSDIKWKFSNFKKTDTTPSPASRGEKFSIPRLMFEAQGEFVFADPDTIFEQFDWDIAKYAIPRLESNEFNIEGSPGQGFYIDIDGNRLNYGVAGKDDLALPFAEVEIWTAANLVMFLDRTLKQEDIPQSQMIDWLRKNIEYLTENRGIKIASLMIAKYALLGKLQTKIREARAKAKTESFDLFRRESRKMLDFDNAFEFIDGMYNDQLYYRGKYKFNKHFLGNSKIPIIDGGETGEEFKCAQAIDTEPEVKFWLRNVSRHASSFKLPTSTDYFYPDFVAMLNDERILVIEYKGAHLADSPDTKEKAMIGAIWEKETCGKGLFMVAHLSKGGLTVAEQIKEKIGSL